MPTSGAAQPPIGRKGKQSRIASAAPYTRQIMCPANPPRKPPPHSRSTGGAAAGHPGGDLFAGLHHSQSWHDTGDRRAVFQQRRRLVAVVRTIDDIRQIPRRFGDGESGFHGFEFTHSPRGDKAGAPRRYSNRSAFTGSSRDAMYAGMKAARVEMTNALPQMMSTSRRSIVAGISEN